MNLRLCGGVPIIDIFPSEVVYIIKFLSIIFIDVINASVLEVVVVPINLPVYI